MLRPPKRVQSFASSQPTHVPVSAVSQTGRSGATQSSAPSHAGAVGSGIHVCAGPKSPVSSQNGRLPAASHERNELTPAAPHDSRVEQQNAGFSLVHAVEANESADNRRHRTALHREVTRRGYTTCDPGAR